MWKVVTAFRFSISTRSSDFSPYAISTRMPYSLRFRLPDNHQEGHVMCSRFEAFEAIVGDEDTLQQSFDSHPGTMPLFPIWYSAADGTDLGYHEPKQRAVIIVGGMDGGRQLDIVENARDEAKYEFDRLVAIVGSTGSKRCQGIETADRGTAILLRAPVGETTHVTTSGDAILALMSLITNANYRLMGQDLKGSIIALFQLCRGRQHSQSFMSKFNQQKERPSSTTSP
ncbi:hypothetical protein BU15DRAFT_65441 [Melanogaster broomeanus]|nr:hypothetical protein BU15DRAFT_65441 [Melanogaster broomeanus]